LFVYKYIKSNSDLEDIFYELGERAHQAGVSLPHHEGSLQQGLTIIYRGHGTYKGNPFRILAHTIEVQTTIQYDRKAIIHELIYYSGYWDRIFDPVV
jgi:hypothetical protein